MKQFLLLTTIFLLTGSIAFAQCGYHPPERKAEVRQKSSVNISQGIHDLEEHTKIKAKALKKIAISQYPGKVKSLKLIVEDGTLAWKLEVKGKEGTKELFLDPSNGAFLGYGLTK